MLRQEVADPEAVDAECKEHQQALFEMFAMPKIINGSKTMLELCNSGCV